MALEGEKYIVGKTPEDIERLVIINDNMYYSSGELLN
jgi:hypothetical protein